MSHVATNEWNFDGLVGPTHHYGGLGLGNLASRHNRASVSSPRGAALEGIAKMRRVAALGVPQAVLPPHERPHLPTLRRLGFPGNDTQVLRAAATNAPGLLSAVASASSMWAANAATVSPSADTLDARVHLTPANLVSQLHRSLEARFTTRVLRRVFTDRTMVEVHDPLPATGDLGDEGPANHGRIAGDHTAAGLEMFVHGPVGTRRFVSRQREAASVAVVRRHGVGRAVHLTQSERAVDAGVFHNDVISVTDLDLFIVHEAAFDDTPAVIADLRRLALDVGVELHSVMIPDSVLGIDDAVRSYLFNSQVITTPTARVMLAPAEIDGIPGIDTALELLSAHVDVVEVLDVRQSMRNGGGPACLRLRVVLTEQEAAGVHPGVVFTDALGDRLEAWVARHYRDTLHPDDLGDPTLLGEIRTALDDLTRILDLEGIYSFQT